MAKSSIRSEKEIRQQLTATLEQKALDELHKDIDIVTDTTIAVLRWVLKESVPAK